MNRRTLKLALVGVTVAGLLLFWALRSGGSVARSIRVRNVQREEARKEGGGRSAPLSGETVGRDAARKTILVRDLANGNPIHGIEIKHRGAPGDEGDRPRRERLVADRNGRISFVETGSDTFLPVDDRWKLPEYADGEVAAVGELWLYRTLHVTGMVRGEGGVLDPQTAQLVALTLGLKGYGHPDKRTPDPWNPLWQAQHRIQRHGGIRAPDEAGRFEADIPRIDGVAIRATAPGWRMTWVRVPVRSSADDAAVELVLRPSYVVSGVLRSETGEPLRRVRVVAYMTRRAGYDVLNMERLQVQGHEGFTAMWSAKDGTSASNHVEQAFTDSEGRYRLDLKTDGEVLLVVHAEGYVPLEQSLGWLNRDSEDNELVARAAHPGKVRILYGGKPLSGHSLTIGDLTRSYLQPAVSVTIDSGSKIPREWLVAGRRYVLVLHGPAVPNGAKGYLHWNGQARLDIKELPRRFTD